VSALDDERLKQAAQDFAQHLSETVSGFLGRPCPFRADVIETGHFSVGEEESGGIQLSAGGTVLLSLELSYQCHWDSSNTYLAVHKSKIAVYAGAFPKGNPLFRYEYERGLGERLPSAHLHVHAHRDAFAHVMSTAGRKSKGSRAGMMLTLGDVPQLQDFHFPQGGHRFRPCLEDILATLKEEFGLDTSSQWKDVLDAGRIKWRRQQVAAAVSDSPDEAVRVLEGMGYRVTREDEGQAERRERVASL